MQVDCRNGSRYVCCFHWYPFPPLRGALPAADKVDGEYGGSEGGYRDHHLIPFSTLSHLGEPVYAAPPRLLQFR